MPIFYNTALPTPTTKNTLNSVTVEYGIRDFLLNSNLGVGTGGFYPQFSMSTNGSPLIGQPVLDTSINGNTNVIPIGLPLEIFGLSRYEIAIIPNQYQNNIGTAPQLINIEDISTIQGVFGSVDFPQGIQTYPTYPTLQVSQFGLLGKSEFAEFRKIATLRDLYFDETKQVDVGDWISLQPSGFNQQLTGYLDEFGNLNQGGGSSMENANTLGSILNGQGIGLANSGIIPNFDLRASLLGRVLGATGAINDTKLGQIGGQQLAFSLANNASFNIQQDILGGLNIQDNLLSLIKDGQLSGFRPNYKITVPKTVGGKIFDFAASILGFTLPKSNLDVAGSIFSSENKSGNIQRANSMLENTGKGQVESLLANTRANMTGSNEYDNPDKTAFRSGYAPGYKDSNDEIPTTPKLYAFTDDVTKGTVLNFLNATDGVIPEISYNRSEMIKQYGFLSPEDTGTGPIGNAGYDNRKISNVGFTWTSTDGEALNSKIKTNSIDLNSSTSATTQNIPDAFPDELPIGDDPSVHQKKSLLAKTQKLFNSKGMLNIVSAMGNMNKKSSQIETANGGGFSKGSAVIQKDRFSVKGIFDGQVKDAANTYCRSWTTLNRYDTVNKMVKSRDLFRFTYPYRHQLSNSVLDDNGFVKVAPYKSDTFSDNDVKKFMLSIENLAWVGESFNNLIECEKGPGDLLTGKKGRIMWFPPYNIQFNETSSVNWEKSDFIGRGESVYTYNNTERTGTLSFQIIVDHPSYVNKFAGIDGPDDNYVASFFAGCVEPNAYFRDRLTPSEQQSITIENVVKSQEEVAVIETPPPSYTVYFPNDVTGFTWTSYENAITGSSSSDVIDYSVNPNGYNFGIGTYQGDVTPGTNSAVTGYTDNYNHGLNYNPSEENQSFEVMDTKMYGAFDPQLISKLNEHITSHCKSCVIEVSGYASKQGSASYNKKLSDGRANSVIETLKSQIFLGMGLTEDQKNERFTVGESKTVDNSTGESPTVDNSTCVKKVGSPTDTLACKKDRKAVIKFSVSDKFLPKDTEPKPKPVEQTAPRNINNNIKKRFYNECSYFEKLAKEDNFVFDSFREKIRYFHPAFHSTTPEGLNSRLTFLQQCTRQGPTLTEQGANNLAFGRPPICILRIGDFYNTKIVIDNLAIDYEPLVWDLNPEGIGVQPMIANVSISFKFIGGSSLTGPINKLQNALSFNYYANSQVYDPRADYISKGKPFVKIKNEKGEIGQLEILGDPGDYYIHNEINDIYFGSANEFNERNVYDVGAVQPTFIQTAASTNSSEQQETPVSSPITAEESTDIERLVVTEAQVSKSNNTLEFNLGRRQGDNTSLSKDYECTVLLQSPTSQKVAECSLVLQVKASDLFTSFSGAVDLFPSLVGSIPQEYSNLVLKIKGTNKEIKATVIFKD